MDGIPKIKIPFSYFCRPLGGGLGMVPPATTSTTASTTSSSSSNTTTTNTPSTGNVFEARLTKCLVVWTTILRLTVYDHI